MKSKYVYALVLALGVIAFGGTQARAEESTVTSDVAIEVTSETSVEAEEATTTGATKPKPPMPPKPVVKDKTMNAIEDGRPGAVPTPVKNHLINNERPTILDAMGERREFMKENGIKPMMDEEARMKMQAEMRTKFANEGLEQARARVHENFGRMIGNFDAIIARIESRLAKMEAAGIDMTEIEAAIDDAKAAIDDARAEHEALKATFEAGATKEDLAAAGSELKASLQSVRDTLQTVVTVMKASVADATGEAVPTSDTTTQ